MPTSPPTSRLAEALPSGSTPGHAHTPLLGGKNPVRHTNPKNLATPTAPLPPTKPKSKGPKCRFTPALASQVKIQTP
jgi:hypothetical protein